MNHTAITLRRTLNLAIRPTNVITQQTRSMGGSRGARGHGWFQKYRAGLGGRHLQGRYHLRDRQKLASINDDVFALNKHLEGSTTNKTTEAYIELRVDRSDDESDEGSSHKRIVIELAAAALPNTCGNFAALCRDGASPYGYESTRVFKIEKNVGICIGDNTVGNDGNGGKCHPDYVSKPQNPYSFDHEHTVISHSQKGIVTMLSSGLDKNDSRFMITTTDESPHLDGKYVAFGRVKEGMEWIEKMVDSMYTKRGRPINDIQVVSSGVL